VLILATNYQLYLLAAELLLNIAVRVRPLCNVAGLTAISRAQALGCKEEESFLAVVLVAGDKGIVKSLDRLRGGARKGIVFDNLQHNM